MSVDGTAAAQTLLNFGTLRHHGACLHYVWQAYKAHGASTGRSAYTALQAWERTEGQHGDRNPPPGVPVWFGARPGSAAGDVVISLGDGRVVATDYPRFGVVGVCTIDERQRQINRPYLGWTDHIFDQPISYPAPAHQEEDDMFDDEARALLRSAVDAAKAAQAAAEAAAADALHVKNQVGGSTARKTTVRQDLDWLKVAEGGSNAPGAGGSTRRRLDELDQKISAALGEAVKEE